MSHNEQLPLPPQLPNAEAVEHLANYAPYGREVILAAENADMAEDMTHAHSAAADFAESMNYRSVKDHESGMEGEIFVADQERELSRQWDGAYQERDLALQRQLRRSRAFFRGLNDSLITDEAQLYKRQRLNDYIADVPTELNEAFGAWRLAKKHETKDPMTSDRLAWLASAPKAQMQQFITWHHGRIETLNKRPDIIERIETDKARYKTKLEAAVGAGLPEEFLAGAAKIGAVPVSVGDIFHTVLQSSHGYTEDGKIVLEEKYDTAIFEHEMSHALFLGLEQRIDNEAFAEHIKLAVINGNISEMNPEERNDFGLYSSERYEMSLELTSGSRGDLLYLGLKAFAEEDLYGPAHQAFNTARNESYGGIDTKEFRKQEVIRGRERVEGFGGNLAEDVKGDYILRYAGSGFKILGALQKGLSSEEILADELAPIRTRYQNSDGGEDVLRHLIPAKQEEVLSHIAEIQVYLARSGYPQS